MTAYFIAQINIEDSEQYQRYLAGYDEVFGRYKGEVLAVDDDVSVLEGEWPYGRTVIIHFPTRSDLLEWYASPEYTAIAQYRRNASTGNIVVARGRE
jgi:uncharacterized protein (DUF1330 family)